ncbi:MAG: pilus assembly protein N-terminal domain-containing protein [Planctomycetota bacterium]
MCSTLIAAAFLVSPAPIQAETEESEPEVRTVADGMHDRVTFDVNVSRVAAADEDIIDVEAIDSRELLVTGLAHGRTSVFVWLADGTTRSIVYRIEPDLTLLRAALADIDPGIEVESAPDRAVLVLKGTVPNLFVRDAAVRAAEAYLNADRSDEPSPIIGTGQDGATAVAPGSDGTGGPRNGSVVDLLRVASLPAPLEGRIADAIEPLSRGEVSVRRVQLGIYPDDEADVFVLEGSVPDQVTLSRLLFVASRTISGGITGGTSEVRVLADEGGALVQVRNLFGAGALGGGGAQQQGLQSANNDALGGGGGGGRQGAFLANRIGAQVGRAKVVEAADGRLLSLVDVDYLPLVRVDVRLYEVNTTKLRTWRSQLTVIGSDFDQGALLPAPAAVGIQGDNAASVGQDQLQGLLGFLDGGLTSQAQLVSGGFAVDALFQLLVQEEVARSLSNPTLTVLSGELAQFQVGGQVPVPVALTVGGGTDQILNAVQFRDFGIDLTVRPLVEEIDSDRITLDVVPRISLPDLALTAAIGDATGETSATTAFESRATRTHTRVFDGDALLIGGLTTQQEEDIQAKTPWLGNVPGLGWLFRNEASETDITELVIVVLPAVVRDARPEARLWAYPSTEEVLRSCFLEVRGRVAELEQAPSDDESAEDERTTEEAARPTEEGNSPDTEQPAAGDSESR